MTEALCNRLAQNTPEFSRLDLQFLDLGDEVRPNPPLSSPS